MRMIKGLALGLIIGLAVTTGVADGRKAIAILDECDPADPVLGRRRVVARSMTGTWALPSFRRCCSRRWPCPRSGTWHGAPIRLLRIEPNKTIKVTNEGGRGHTFTEVANFGGGMVPPLNQGLTPAPECGDPGVIAATALDPGEGLELKELPEGDHRFMCCIHPWMRTQIKVADKHGND